jgi:hypothetical protein
VGFRIDRTSSLSSEPFFNRRFLDGNKCFNNEILLTV